MGGVAFVMVIGGVGLNFVGCGGAGYGCCEIIYMADGGHLTTERCMTWIETDVGEPDCDAAAGICLLESLAG